MTRGTNRYPANMVIRPNRRSQPLRRVLQWHTDGLNELEGEPLNPPMERDVIDGDTSLGIRSPDTAMAQVSLPLGIRQRNTATIIR